jgi:hypothetical protein
VMQDEKDRKEFSETIRGKILNALGYLFSVYCVWKIVIVSALFSFIHSFIHSPLFIHSFTYSFIHLLSAVDIYQHRFQSYRNDRSCFSIILHFATLYSCRSGRRSMESIRVVCIGWSFSSNVNKRFL